MNKPTTPSVTVRTSNARALRLRPPPVLLENGEANDDDELFLAAPDPLALEPLSDAEIRELEAPDADGVDEQSEGAFEELRKVTEAKLPLDPDAASSMTEPADAHLDVRTRNRGPRGKRKKAKG